MRLRAPVFIFCLLWCGIAFAALHFPALTGRVVDDAHILSAQGRQSLEQALADYERGTSNQVVVVTLPSLGGDTIEDYGYQLGRHWQIGQKGKDNGVLLIIAPNERKVRIEVGYGLEPLLTDATSSVIVQQIILPYFRAGRMEQGVLQGTQAILSALGGHSITAQNTMQNQMSPAEAWIILALFVWIIFLQILGRRHPLIANALLFNSSFRFGGSGLGGGSWSSGGSGGGFFGGGGSFGGGGASGGW